MFNGRNRRLANPKTLEESGLSYVLSALDISTPYGKKELKALRPFFPGDEEALRETLNKLESMVKFVKEHQSAVNRLEDVFMCMKEVGYTIERSEASILSEVEIYEIKTLLLQMRNITKICYGEDLGMPEDFCLGDTTELLDILDPRHDRLNTFYLYDSFSEKLAQLRKDKRQLEISIRKAQKAKKEEIRKAHGIDLTPKFDVVISKSDDNYQKALEIEELVVISEDYATATFQLRAGAECDDFTSQLEVINGEIDEEETTVRKSLSEDIARFKDVLLENCNKIGRLDFVLAKAKLAIKRNCTKPQIVEEHVIQFDQGRQLKVEAVLNSKGKEYTPISIGLYDGVTCITGANMGGKTISLKLTGLVPLMAQYGLFVPCEGAKVGLSNYIRILIGDCQSVERGLSSFGSEMEELKDILDTAQERSLILIDEIASGTNPVEGLALTKSLVDYLKKKPYIVLITTHFETVTWDAEIRNMQVRGLASADFRKLDSQLRYANRRERINIIGRYMDYRLMEVNENTGVPKDALNIAKMLGISKEIIEGAQEYIKKQGEKG